MARLIDADALQLEPDPWGGMNGVLCLGRSGGKTMATVQAALRCMIDNAPTVYAVPVEQYIELREQYDRVFTAFHELRDDFISYVCGGIPVPSPYCKNRCAECVDAYGWCKWNDKCHGFNPAEVFLDEERRTDESSGNPTV